MFEWYGKNTAASGKDDLDSGSMRDILKLAF
jgi:hypothetical protein